MFGNPYGTGLTFTKVISGISKTLNVANQVIPLYKEAKPMINNARNIFGALKDLGKSNNTQTVSSPKVEATKKDTTPEPRTVSSHNPTFFL